MSHQDDIRIDLKRRERIGFPEIVYGEFKSADQIARILSEHVARQAPLLITRLSAEKVPAEAGYDAVARTFSWWPGQSPDEAPARPAQRMSGQTRCWRSSKPRRSARRC